MTDLSEFEAVSLPSAKIDLSPYEAVSISEFAPVRQAKGISTRQTPEEAGRSEEALKFAGKSLLHGALNTLLATTGASKYASPYQLEEYLSSGEIGPSSEQSIEQLIGRGEAQTPEQTVLGRIFETA